MNSTEDIENINILTQYLNGFVISKTVFTACEMGVFDLLLGSKELLSSKMISDRLSSSLKGMEKLLDACVALKLLKVERKNTQDPVVQKTSPAPLLEEISLHLNNLKNSFNNYFSLRAKLHETNYTWFDELHEDAQVKGDTILAGKHSLNFPSLYRDGKDHFSEGLLIIDRAFGEAKRKLTNSLRSDLCQLCREREGKWQREKFDNSPKNIFEELYSSKENIKKIMLAMNASCSLCGRDVMTAFDLSHFPLICDVGGCGGALAKECISLYPNSTITILDLPEVVKIAKKDFVSAEEHRINFCAVDFFKDPVPEADLYILARILLDWDDESCMELLTKVHKACKPGGGVLISEIVLNEDRSGPIEAHFASMLLLFYFEGKIRTPSELSRLLSATGFKEIQMKKTQSQYNVILARK